MLQEGNLTMNESCKNYDGILSPIFYIDICCIIGLLYKTIILYICFLRRHTDSSMADTLLTLLCLPLRVYYHNKEGPFYLCKVLGGIFYINM
ncbi:hypothetical protein ABG768_008158 [Culter alburnus]|uniref:Uncharacterized protein n=1 Tax=Culter alburnus TaxID=194366 RepID=A0AAW1ZMP6_CULAL